jgi:beta-galactosidase
MGNSNGNFMDYWELFRQEDQLQGGFIWDWKDQGLLRTKPDGETYIAYGGDVGRYDIPNDKDFCLNGLVFSDGSPKPAIWEVKKAHQNFWFYPKDLENGQISVFNEHFFISSEAFEFSYEIKQEATIIAKGVFELNGQIDPQESKDLNFPIDFKMKPEKEYVLNLYATHREGTVLIPENHVVASEQFILQESGLQSQSSSQKGELSTLENEKNLYFFGTDFTILFDKEKGTLIEWNYRGYDLIRKGLEFDTWRVPTSNDRGNQTEKRLAGWKDVEERRKLVSFSLENLDKGTYKVYTQSVIEPENSRIDIEYLVHGNGNIDVSVSFIKASDELPEIPRIGMNLVLVGGFDLVRWYGKGPFESYADRKSAAMIDVYEGTVIEQYTPYPFPQESGNKTHVRWMEVFSENGLGIRISGHPEINAGCYHFTQEDLDNELTHDYEIPFRELTEIRIDYGQKGVGGDNSWGNDAHDQYRLLDKEYRYSFTLSPYKQ